MNRQRDKKTNEIIDVEEGADSCFGAPKALLSVQWFKFKT